MHILTRRGFMALCSAMAGVMATTGLSFGVEPVESDALKKRVAAGELPPIEQRLPDNPLVITPTDRPGQQGGVWNHALVGGGSLSMLFRYQAYEPLLRFNADWDGVEPNVAEMLRGQRRFNRIHLPPAQGPQMVGRRALHDRGRAVLVRGHLHEQGRRPGGIQALLAGRRRSRPSWRSIDETTFRVKFAEPNGFFVQQIAWANQDQLTRAPAHYLEAVPHQVQSGRQRARPGARLRKLDRAVPERRAAWCRTTTSSSRIRPTGPTLMAWIFTIAPGRGYRAGRRGPQSLLLQGRHRGHPAALFRRDRLPDGRRPRGPAAQDACRARST